MRANKRNKGKAGIIVCVFIALAIIAGFFWYFVINRNANSEYVEELPLVQSDIPDEAEPDVPEEDLFEEELQQEVDEEEPEPEPTPEPTPTPTPEPEVIVEIPPEDTIISIADADPELFEMLNSIASDFNAAAVSMIMFDGNTATYFTYEFGYADMGAGRPVDVDTVFRVASLAKLTTVICTMVLVDQGLIDLDEDISVYLGYDVVNPYFPESIITVRMLMQHTSSIFDSDAFRNRNSSVTMRSFLERRASFVNEEPGTYFDYSNLGYSVLGAINELVSGKTMDTLAREVLFEPLGIDAAYVSRNLYNTNRIAQIYDNNGLRRTVQSMLATGESGVLGRDMHIAQGNLFISVIDYARILAMLGNGGQFRDVKILSREAVEAIHETNFEVYEYGYMQGLAVRYSHGDIIPGTGFYWHTGSAFGVFAQYIYVTDDNMNRGVVVVTTGATTGREANNMITVCTQLSLAMWERLSVLLD